MTARFEEIDENCKIFFFGNLEMANRSLVRNCGEPNSKWVRESSEPFFITLEGKTLTPFFWTYRIFVGFSDRRLK